MLYESKSLECAGCGGKIKISEADLQFILDNELYNDDGSIGKICLNCGYENEIYVKN